VRACERGLRDPDPDVDGTGPRSEKVAGLEMGADDYLTKPFSLPS
jgi:CheY-like chemotaxis protein